MLSASTASLIKFDPKGVMTLLMSSPTKAAWMVLGALVGMAFVVVPLLVARLVRWWRQKRADGVAVLGVSTLERLWRRFLANLPRSARTVVARYPAIVVLGPAGAGKSQLIREFVDWQGQSSQFLPSLTDNPLLQIYLGGKLIVEEVSSQILANNSAVAAQALRRLWEPVCREQAPLTLIVLNMMTLETATPEERADLAHQLRGKLSLLGKLVDAPVEARLCLTHLDQIRGFTQLARFCAAHRIPLWLPLPSADASKEKDQEPVELTRFLPLALTKLPAADFREVVLFLKEVPRIQTALEGLLKPLREWSVAAKPPILERVYLHSTAEGAHGSSPIAGRKIQPVTSWSNRIKSLLPASLRAAQWHLIASVAIVLLTTAICLVSAVRQRSAIARADEAINTFAEAVHRAQATLGDVRESPAVRSASHSARQAIEEVNVDENSFFIHRILYRGSKLALTRRLLEVMRDAYFLPLLQRYGAQRDVERGLYTLAVIYSSRDNALGSLVASELRDIALALGISDAIINDYVQLSAEPWERAAAVPWNRMVSTEPKSVALTDSWLRYFSELQQIYRSRNVTTEQLHKLQLGAAPLMRIADAVRTKRKLAQMLNAIAEESPLVEVEDRIGKHFPELSPPQWLRDQQAAISATLHLIHDTDQQAVRAGQLSLTQVLRLLTDLDERKRNEDQVYAFEIDERSFSFSARVWADMLLRGRNQLVLGALYKASDLPAESGQSAGASRSSGHGRTHGASADAGEGSERGHHRSHHQRRHHGKSGKADREPDATAVASAAERPSRQHHHGSRHDRDNAAPAHLGAEPQISAAEARQYSRASYEQDMKTLLQKLDKALNDNSGLPAPQRQYLTKYVEGEARRYSERYCAALLMQYKSYVFPGGALSSTRSALVELLQPNGSLLTHLKSVADNANLPGLDGRFMQPLASCLSQLKPVTSLMVQKDGAYPALKPYAEIIAGVLKELDTGKPAQVMEDGKAIGLSELLSPLGRLGLSILMEQESSPERKVEQYLESAGLGGPLTLPFLAPIRHLSRLATAEVEQVLNQQWESLQQTVRPVLSRYPFDRRAERELQPSELDLFKPGMGSFWVSFRQVFSPVCVEQGGVFNPRKWPRGSIALPRDMLPLVNQLAGLSSALYSKDGNRKPIEIAVKALPVSVCDPARPSAVSFLSVGKTQVFGVNTRPETTALLVPWWQQDIAAVGLEFAKGAQARSAQSIEVADSLWNFFRLLERASASGRVLTWALPGSGGQVACEVRFELDRDPMALFRVKSR